MLLTAELVVAIDELINNRNVIGVTTDNPYIFAAPTRNSKSHLRGNDCLAKILTNCNLQRPEGIKSTKLRKYVATVLQIIDLNKNELEWLARHMGHDVSVHRQYYRLQDSTLELAKVSKLLLAVDEGNAGNFSGKKLNEITLEGKYFDITS